MTRPQKPKVAAVRQRHGRIWHQHAVEQQLPDVTEHDTADQVRHEKYGTENIGSFDAFGQKQCNCKRQYIDQDHTDYRKGCRIPECVYKGAVFEYFGIVGKSNKFCIVNRCKTYRMTGIHLLQRE